MAFTNQTSHYGLPQYIGTDRPKYLTDVNDAYKKIDDEIYSAQQAAATADASAELANTNANSALTNANAAVQVANVASETAKTAEEKAVTAGNTADSAKSVAEQAETSATNAVAIANNANTLAGEASGVANSAKTEADTAVKVGGNIANAYDSTKTYKVGDFCLYNGTFYKCITAVTKGEAFNVDKWDDVTVGEELLNLTGGEAFDPSEINKTLATHTTQLDGLYFGQNEAGEYGYKTSESGDIVPFKKAAGATGDAEASDVLSGRTFSNASGVGIEGTMVNHGTQTVTLAPEGAVTETETLEAGYYAQVSVECDGTKAYNAGKEAAEHPEVIYAHAASSAFTINVTLTKDYDVIYYSSQGSDAATVFTYTGSGTINTVGDSVTNGQTGSAKGHGWTKAMWEIYNAKSGDTFKSSGTGGTYLTQILGVS